MPHETGLIATISVALVVAFVGGFVASRLRLPPIVGYLLAGVAIGPFTPGFVGDATIAPQLAEIGVILLMFGVGIHFSVRDLLSVWRIAVPGAVGQITIATLLGIGIATLWGWQLGAGFVLGLAISVASTVVLLRSLMERDELDSVAGRVAVGWLIVEDLFTVLVLVLLPTFAGLLGGTALAGASGATTEVIVREVAFTLAKVAVLVVLMLFVGARFVPWLLNQVVRNGSRELFTLAVLAVAMGVAFGSAILFGVSLALGAFLAGLVVSESDLSHQAAADALPFRDAFAVLFFVSVGMLFDPAYVLQAPLQILMVLAVVVFGKGLAAVLIVRLLNYPLRTGLVVAAGLAQIGEFSFILAEVGRGVGLLPDEGYNVILAGALLSITLNPLLFAAIDPIERALRNVPWIGSAPRTTAASITDDAVVQEAHALSGHAVICGYGRVGSTIGTILARRHLPFLVIEQNPRRVDDLQEKGIHAIQGDASNQIFLEHANLESARMLIITVAEIHVSHLIIDHARRINPNLDIVARSHSGEELEQLQGMKVEGVLAEMELAITMAQVTLRAFGNDDGYVRSWTDDIRFHAHMGSSGQPITVQEASSLDRV